jgi:hypothetical protein
LKMSLRVLALGRVWLALVVCAGLVASCRGKSATTEDSETHFLSACTDTCSGGLTCICGVCTKPCTTQDSCGELSESAACEDSCAEASTKFCDVACAGDAECSRLGGGFVCNAGHCRPEAELSSGGTGSTGDTSNTGGAGHPSGVGGSAMSAGAGGSADTPARACKASPATSPSLPAPTELDPEVLARAAAVVGSCVPDDGVARIGEHIWGEHLGSPLFHHRLGAQLDCLANAACGCAAVEQCLGVTYGVAPEAGCTTQCDGDLLTGCEEGQRITVNCGYLGQSCDMSLNCVSEPARACEESEEPTCTAEGEVSYCSRGILRETPCQSFGFSCVNGECVGEGSACDDFADPAQLEIVGTGCSGDTLQACLGRHTTTLDCTTQGPGFGCRAAGGTFFCGLAADCVPPNDAGLPATPTSCDGTVLSFCNAGRLERVDCTSLGFSGCDLDTSVGHYGCTPGVTGQ